MKQLLYMSVNSYFFRGKSNTATFRRCLNLCKRHFSALTAVQDTRQDVSTKPLPLTKKQDNLYLRRKFCSYSDRSLTLMDFDFWLYPKFSAAFKSLYYYIFVLKDLDDSFSLAEFTNSTVTALQVVTSLLSELKFSELEGLLTQKCKEEVERNLKYWSRDFISILPVQPDKIIKIYPCEIVVVSDENSNKVHVEIRVIHYVWLEISKFYKPKFIPEYAKIVMESSGVTHMLGVFNSKFIREFTRGVSDQWTINAINVKFI